MAEEKVPATSAKLIAEFTGTFLLIFTIGCNVLSAAGSIWIGTSIACVLMVSIFAFGATSGANFNPAVSVALGINGNMKWDEVGIYSAVQIVAGIVAGFAYFALFGKTFNLAPTKGFSVVAAALCEILYTFMLCFVVLNVAAVKKGCQQYFGLAIGFVIIAGAYGAGAVSGGCFNPAVAFGIDVSSAHLGLGWCLAYTVFELIGAGLAAGLFKVVRPEGGKADEEYSTVSMCVSEFLGTYILVLTVGLNVMGKSPAGAFSIAASLMCMIYALGDVSGAKFNPAVSLAVLISKAEGHDVTRTVTEMGAQIAGGIAAAFTYAGIYGGKAFPLGPGAGYTIGQALTAETIFTFVLCLTVLCAAVHCKDGEKKDGPTMFFGLAIGACVTCGGNAIGAVSGGSLNPAVSIGLASAATLSHLMASTHMDVITQFFNACESGKGWDGCKQHVLADATFSCQAVDALPGPPVTECKTVASYAEWMKGVCENFGDKATYAIEASAFDQQNMTALFFATFGGFSHYVYKIGLNEEGKVTSMVKVWNDAHAAKVIAAGPAA